MGKKIFYSKRGELCEEHKNIKNRKRKLGTRGHFSITVSIIIQKQLFIREKKTKVVKNSVRESFYSQNRSLERWRHILYKH
jgi:hypothetical protein